MPAAWTEAQREAARLNARGLDVFDAAREERRCAELGAALIALGEPAYPELLASIADPPRVLYVLGRLDAKNPIAIVGTRTPSMYGRRMARRLAGDAARAGITVVSGLARGIDTEAHLAAVEAGKPTWAVLGTGLARLYPAENAGLARRIVAGGGAVISERPLDTPPTPDVFPRRNRIISGLSWATAVVEGRHKSGAMITARKALEQGRGALAVPCPADSVLAEGPNSLLRDGAPPAVEAEDLLAALPPGQLAASRGLSSREAARAAAPVLEGDEAKIVALIGSDALSLDELVQLSGLDTMVISSIMFGLELKGSVISVPGQRYAQKEAR